MVKAVFNQLSMALKIGYGMGNVTYGIISQMMGFFMVFYATSILGISGRFVGVAVAISVIWDAVTDPVMGYLSDITRNKLFGKRHLYILIGCVFLSIDNYFLWKINPEWSEMTKFVLLLILLLLAKTFITIYTTPYTALGAELTTEYSERTTIQGIRTMFFLTGIIAATGMGLAIFFRPTENYPNGQLNPQAYGYMGLTGSIIALTFGLICFFSTFSYIHKLPVAEDVKKEKSILNIFIALFETLKNKDYRYIVIGYLFTNIASAIFSTIGLHVFTYTFGLNNSQIATIMGIQFIVCILAQPVWIFISKRMDKKPTVMLGLFVCLLSSFMMIVLVFMKDSVYDHVLPIMPFAAVLGFGIAGLFSLPLSMIADTIDVEELNTGKRSEGTYFGVLTLAYKASQAVAIFLLSSLLDVVGFDSSLAVQPHSTVFVFGLTIALGSGIAFVLAMFFYNKYSLDATKVSKIQKELSS